MGVLFCYIKDGNDLIKAYVLRNNSWIIGWLKGHLDYLARLFYFLYNEDINNRQLEIHEIVALVLKEMDKKRVLWYVEQDNK